MTEPQESQTIISPFQQDYCYDYIEPFNNNLNAKTIIEWYIGRIRCYFTFNPVTGVTAGIVSNVAFIV